MATTSFYSSTGLAAEDATALESYKNQAALSAEASATSAASAASALTDARAAQTAAELALDSFTDIYLGAKSSAPSVDNDGDALVTGTQYFDTTLGEMQVYNGSTWQFASLSEALEAPNNLSELTNAATARTNLGLGTAATTASSDYATAAQGSAAVSALSASTLNTSKLNTIETNADVTDTANVVAALSAGTGIGLSSGGEISNSAPDQTVALTGSGNISVSGTYPNFTIATSANNYVLPFTDNSSNWNTAFGWGNHASQSYATQSYVDTEISSITSGSAAQNMTGDIDMNNNDIIDVHLLKFNDPGWDEGIEWLQGNGWKICESPNNLGNGGGNLQFGTNTTRRATLDTSGSLWTQAQGTLLGSSVANTITHDSGLTIRTSSQGAGSKISFTDNPDSSYNQIGYLTYKHSDSSSYGSKNSIVFDSTETTMSVVAKDKLLFKSLYQVPSSGTGAGTVVVDENRNITANDITITGDLKLEDNERARFGDSQDFDIYFDGSDARIRAHNGQLKLQANGKNALVAQADGTVQISYNGSTVLETTSEGVVVDSGLKIDNSTNTVVKVGGYAANSRSMLELAEDRNNSNAMHWGFSLCAEGDSDNNFHLLRHSNSTSGVKALTVARDTGDISFRNDSGTEKLIWDASASSLNVTGTVTATGLTVDTDTLYVDSTNNRVGIGTSSPNTGSGTNLSISSDVTTRLLLENTATNGKEWGIYSGSSGVLGFYDYSSSSEAMRIDSSGNVGIGTTSPSSLYTGANNLVVGGGSSESGMTIYSSSTTDGNIYFADGTSGSAPYSGFLEYNHSSNFFRVGVNASERMRIDSSGNVGIGTSGPAYTLTVKKDVDDYIAKLENDGNSASSNGLWVDTRWNTATNTVFKVTTNSGSINVITAKGDGNVGIGTSNPTARLHIEKQANLNEAAPHFAIKGAGYFGSHWLDGNAYYIGQNSTVRRMRIYSGSESSGVNLSNGQTSWGTFSDERLKYDVEPVENAVESLSNLRTVKYRLKDVDSTEDKKKIGLMAQDLVGVLDEVIDPVKKTGDDTEYMSVRYTELMPVLVKAIQEQQTLIESLTARIAALEE